MDVHMIFREFADSTSMHGVPRIINAKSKKAKIFWSIICIGAFGMFLWQTGVLLERYYSYPKKVNVEIIQQPVEFPWVTVCNTDHLDAQVVDIIENLIYENNVTDEQLSDDEYLAFYEAYMQFFTESSVFLYPYAQLNHNYMQDLKDVYSRIGLVANLGTDIASTSGVKLKDFIISCRFLGEECDFERDFSVYFDPYYFNCFTYKPNANISARASRLIGPEYGLSLILFMGSAGQLKQDNENDVIPGIENSDLSLASGRGAKVVVHSPGTRPYPKALGYESPPGFSVTLGVSASENMRIESPHGNCANGESNSTFSYTLMECSNKYLQKKITDKCKCIDNKISIPEQTGGLPFCYKIPPTNNLCNLDYENPAASPTSECLEILNKWGDQMECRSNLTLYDSESDEKCMCAPPCFSLEYQGSYSLSNLPNGLSNFYAFTIDKYLDSLKPVKKNLLEKTFGQGSPLNEQLTKLISRVNVYITNNNVIKTTESGDYEAARLVSDIGGQVALWIGISVMTIFEVVQLVLDLLRFLGGSAKT